MTLADSVFISQFLFLNFFDYDFTLSRRNFKYVLSLISSWHLISFGKTIRFNSSTVTFMINLPLSEINNMATVIAIGVL